MDEFEKYLSCWETNLAEPAFWRGERGERLVAELQERFVDAVIARFASQMKSRCPLEREEVLASLVVLLMDQNKLTKLAGDNVENPAAYFCVVAANEIVRKELGTLAQTVEDDSNAFRSSIVVDVPDVQPLEMLVATPQGDIARVGAVRTGDLTPIGEACKSATEKLRAYMPSGLVGDVRVIVDWFALNPPQHRGHGHSQAAREPFLQELGLSEKQAMAFAKILWGTRYREPETSLLGWYMKHPGTSPTRSRSHVDALSTFRTEMRALQEKVRRSAAA